MVKENISTKLNKKIEKYKMHNFIRKMFQKDVFDKLIEYIQMRSKCKNGANFKPKLINPVSINLDLTTACNYYCDHCIDLEFINNGHMIKSDNIKKLIDFWVNKGLKSVIVIGGGEPTLYSDFREVITFLKSKDLELGIASNGSRMECLSDIAHLLNSCDWVRLSLDAGTEETFSKMHNPKVNISLEGILKDVKEMRSKYSDYQMGFSFLVCSDEHISNNKGLVNNISEIALAARKAKENKFSYFSIKPFICTSGQRPTRFKANYNKEITKQIEVAKKLEDKNFKIIESFNLLSLFNNLDAKLKIQPKTCHAQFFRLAVCPDGIFNCTLWRGFDMSYLIDTQQEIDGNFFVQLENKLLECIENFDAVKECSGVSCIYNDFNWFIEDMINNPEKLKDLEKTDNFYDYFL